MQWPRAAHRAAPGCWPIAVVRDPVVAVHVQSGDNGVADDGDGSAGTTVPRGDAATSGDAPGPDGPGGGSDDAASDDATSDDAASDDATSDDSAAPSDATPDTSGSSDAATDRQVAEAASCPAAFAYTPANLTAAELASLVPAGLVD